MRVAMISDIHANLEALEAVLADIETRGVDTMACLGDVVGYGCDPAACLDLVNANCEIRLMGNHEYIALGCLSTDVLNEFANEAMVWTKEHLTDRELSCIAGFEMTAMIGNALLVHASPKDPEQWQYVLTPDAASAAFRHLDCNLCFIGHTHIPLIFSMARAGQLRRQAGHDFLPDSDVKYLVNVGSVGQPRDNDPRACYVIFDTDGHDVLYHRVEYDVRRVQEKMARAHAPAVLIERLAVGR